MKLELINTYLADYLPKENQKKIRESNNRKKTKYRKKHLNK